MKKVYFQGLNEIRAIAALLVVFHHTEQYKSLHGYTSLYDTFLYDHIDRLGNDAVYIFFVLSGFLITFLLLQERAYFDEINLKKFYLRRVFRILPLYYLILFLSFCILPFLANNFDCFQQEHYYYNQIVEFQKDPYPTLLLFILLLPNVAYLKFPAVVGAVQAWSIGVEEQFYLIWPIAMNKLRTKLPFLLFIGFIAITPVIPALLNQFSTKLATNCYTLLKYFPISYMAYGALGAFLLYYYETTILKICCNPILFVANTLFFIYLLFMDISFEYRNELLSLVIMFEILFIIQENFTFNLRSKILNKLGRISYGIYMYHTSIIFIIYATLQHGLISLNLSQNPVLAQFIILGVTVFVSYLSYDYFEHRFVRFKNERFNVFKSNK